MKQTQSNCNPGICNQTDLMTNDGVFMDKEKIKEDCDCKDKPLCLQIADLLLNHKFDLALNLLNGKTD